MPGGSLPKFPADPKTCPNPPEGPWWASEGGPRGPSSPPACRLLFLPGVGGPGEPFTGRRSGFPPPYTRYQPAGHAPNGPTLPVGDATACPCHHRGQEWARPGGSQGGSRQGKGCSAPSTPGVVRMSAIPEALGRPRSSSSRSLAGTLESTLGMGTLEMEKERILKVCFYSNSFNMGKNFKLVKCSVTTEIREVIRSILVSGRIGPDIKLAECYGLRLKHVKSDEIHWLHPDLTVGEVQEKYECLHLEAEWRYDLQIRYLPEDFIERFQEDRTTLLYFYQQVRSLVSIPCQNPCLHPLQVPPLSILYEYPLKEVGLDLFFPSQMQENLKLHVHIHVC
ncbi:PREDICTED: protein-tyrosine kinase 2-beta-like, partial [Calidris pugnax]|uniref:protein-tyrosine kinase 2-beta-like n=1 Tax=Calidris pugnax TaxID=198806 RepID=UPI00071DDE28